MIFYCYQTLKKRPKQKTKTLAGGIYVSRNTYIKPGVTDWDNVNPVHLVCYYRYFRFFSNGEFLSKTSPHKLAQVHKTFKSRYLAAKDDTVYHGEVERVVWAPFVFASLVYSLFWRGR